MIRTVSYFRMSSSRQETSLPQQKAWAEGAAKAHGLEVLRAFEDGGIPGDEIARRPGFLAMIAYCQECHQRGDPVEAVLTYDADRFSRASSVRTAAVLCQLLDAGINRMVTAEGVVDFDSDTDLMVFNVKQDASKAAYSKLLSRRVTHAAIRRAKEGKWNGGPPPYAYAAGPDGFLAVADPGRAEAVRWLFTTYATTVTSLSRLANQLTARGVPPPRCGRWTKSGVWHILANPLYTGDYYYARLKQGKYHTVKDGQAVSRRPVKTKSGRLRQVEAPAEDVIVVRDAHPALTTRQTFEIVKHKMAGLCLGKGPRGKHPRLDWPLAGLLECPDCHTRLWGFTVRDRKTKEVELRAYRCATYTEKGREACYSNDVAEDRILPAVCDAIRQRFSDPALLKKVRAAVEASRTNRQDDGAERVAGLRRAKGELAAKIKAGTEKLALLPPDLMGDMIEQLRAWKAERERVEAEAVEAERAAAAGAEEDDLVERAMTAFARLGEMVRGEDPAAFRDAIRPLVERVEMTFDHLEQGPARCKSVCTSATVHFRPLGDLLKPLAVSLGQSQEGGPWHP